MSAEIKDLVVFEETTVLQAFSEPSGLDPLVSQARQIVDGFKHDLSTDAGRKRTASLAHKVAKFKTRIDGLGKDLVSEWKAKSKAVDANRKAARDALDELKAEARAPLTEWEQEQERIAAEEAARIEAEKLAAQVDLDHELALLLNEKITAERIAEEARIEKERQEAIRAEEERQLELQRQAAEAARIEAEEKAKEREVLAEKEKQEAIEKAAEADRQRIAAEERAKVEAEISERNRIEAEKQAKIQAEKAAEAAKQKQIEDQLAAEKAKADDLARREANKRHVSKIRGEAKDCFIAAGCDDVLAKKLVLAIHAGEIKNVTISY